MIYTECRHIKSSGSKCQAPSLRGMPYCYFHMRLHRALHGRKADPAAAANADSDVALDLPPVEDRNSIQLALTQVLQDLAGKRLDPRRAGRLLYGLQIASQIVDPSGHVAAEDYVQTVSTGSSGEEIAPDQLVCDEDDDCKTCAHKQTCYGSECEEDKGARKDRKETAIKGSRGTIQ
jgi:hypothetical protein